MRQSIISEGPLPVKELMTLMADNDELHDDKVVIRAERSVGDKDLCEFFPRLVSKSTPLSTAGAIGTEPDTLPDPMRDLVMRKKRDRVRVWQQVLRQA